ncbi:MAG: FliM/FliN family flagellar motor switch protein [Chloroflexi bacterium]|nr:FliM/FliN family flagellar motor switch protein [Chloroflexota bacterium]
MLTQTEIDALLAGAVEVEEQDGGTGVNLAEMLGQPAAVPKDNQASGRQVRPYNFWSPDRFSKEQMRAVELVHENLAERLTTSLPPYLRTEFRPRVVHIEQGRADELLKDLPLGTLFHLLVFDPLPGRSVLIVGQEISGVILERLLGGSGWSDHKGRPLTDIGQALLKGTVEYMLNDFKAAWSKVVALEPRLEDSTVNQHWVQMMMGNARMMLVMFEIAIQGVTGTMGVYIPFSMLKPVANVLNPHVWIAGRDERRADESARQRTLAGLHKVIVPLRVILGSAELTIDEITGLRPGDVVRLDAPIKQDLPVRVGSQVRFRGRIGTIGNRLAVQIASVALAGAGGD